MTELNVNDSLSVQVIARRPVEDCTIVIAERKKLASNESGRYVDKTFWRLWEWVFVKRLWSFLRREGCIRKAETHPFSGSSICLDWEKDGVRVDVSYCMREAADVTYDSLPICREKKYTTDVWKALMSAEGEIDDAISVAMRDARLPWSGDDTFIPTDDNNLTPGGESRVDENGEVRCFVWKIVDDRDNAIIVDNCHRLYWSYGKCEKEGYARCMQLGRDFFRLVVQSVVYRLPNDIDLISCIYTRLICLEALRRQHVRCWRNHGREDDRQDGLQEREREADAISAFTHEVRNDMRATEVVEAVRSLNWLLQYNDTASKERISMIAYIATSYEANSENHVPFCLELAKLPTVTAAGIHGTFDLLVNLLCYPTKTAEGAPLPLQIRSKRLLSRGIQYDVSSFETLETYSWVARCFDRKMRASYTTKSQTYWWEDECEAAFKRWEDESKASHVVVKRDYFEREAWEVRHSILSADNMREIFERAIYLETHHAYRSSGADVDGKTVLYDVGDISVYEEEVEQHSWTEVTPAMLCRYYEIVSHVRGDDVRSEKENETYVNLLAECAIPYLTRYKHQSVEWNPQLDLVLKLMSDVRSDVKCGFHLLLPGECKVCYMKHKKEEPIDFDL